MTPNIFKSQKSELGALLQEVLAQNLPPLFRVYHELVQQMDAGTKETFFTPSELAESVGYSIPDLRSILQDLSTLGFIECREVGEENEPWTVRMLVH